MATATGCSCGCSSTMTAHEAAAEPCSCGCGGPASKSRKDEIAELKHQREMIEHRLSELATSVTGD